MSRFLKKSLGLLVVSAFFALPLHSHADISSVDAAQNHDCAVCKTSVDVGSSPTSLSEPLFIDYGPPVLGCLYVFSSVSSSDVLVRGPPLA